MVDARDEVDITKVERVGVRVSNPQTFLHDALTSNGLDQSEVGVKGPSELITAASYRTPHTDNNT